MMEIYKVNITDRDGNKQVLDAPEGYRLMEIIRDHDLPIKAECGGCCACATCHIYVSGDWLDKLPEQQDDEVDMLDEAFDVEDNSRLSCQIIMSKELDGIDVTLAPDGE